VWCELPFQIELTHPSIVKAETRVVAAGEGISAAAKVLAAGGVVALPTETVYGLGAGALDPVACAKIFEAKDRPLSDPLIVHLPAIEWLDRLAVVPDSARRLAEHFWPGPLTLVLPRRETVPDLVTAGQDTVAIRMSSHPVFQEVLNAFGRPVAAPSANRFGRISPTCAADVLAELGGRIPLVLDGGPCVHGIESTIVLVNGDGLHILRSGPVTAEELAPFGAVHGAVVGITAPGGLPSHYAPRTPMRIGPPVEQASRLLFPQPGSRDGCPTPFSVGLLSWESSGEGFAKVERLSRKQDLREAAANLYGAMRRLDEAGLDGIVAEPVPETGLGAAIMERLRKASAR
jgi:L-threonylcarbamoyladenylate synthase